MPYRIEIKEATKADAPAILEIMKDAFAKYERDLGMQGHVTALKETVEDIERDIEKQHAIRNRQAPFGKASPRADKMRLCRGKSHRMRKQEKIRYSNGRGASAIKHGCRRHFARLRKRLYAEVHNTDV